MKIWLDNHLSPALARWIENRFHHECAQVRDLGLARATDPAIFHAARDAGAVLVSKDSDFAELVERMGPPPALIWLTCGNTSEQRLRELFERHLPTALALIEGGETVVEIGNEES